MIIPATYYKCTTISKDNHTHTHNKIHTLTATLVVADGGTRWHPPPHGGGGGFSREFWANNPTHKHTLITEIHTHTFFVYKMDPATHLVAYGGGSDTRRWQ